MKDIKIFACNSARDFAKEFYASTAWKNCREIYKKKKCYLCEICNDIATEVHHIDPITPDNVDNPEVTLNENNLMCLCHQCHMNMSSMMIFSEQ